MITRVGIVVIALLGMLLAACGGTATSPSVSGQPIEVKIKLTDFNIESDIKTFEKGVTYRLKVTNEGMIAHDFTVLPVGAQHDMSGAGMHDEGVVVQIPASDLPPGGSKQVLMVFKETTAVTPLEMACHVPGHYQAGMKLGIAVN